jgi:restriction system protein
MAKNDPTNVTPAFEMLLEEIEAEINFQEKLGARAFEKHDHDAARKAADCANQIVDFRDQVVSLQREWESLMLSLHDRKEETSGTQQPAPKRLPRGMSTPQSAYRQPILQALIEMGGSGHMSDVLARVEQLMRGKLKELDYEPLPSDGTLRWSKSAQWTRNRMAREGLLKEDSPRGIWEISEAGRQLLLRETR